MNFFEWLVTKRKTLATMNLAELRAQELLLANERNRLQARIGKLAQDKQQIVEKGAREKTPELRRTFAQQFDLLHTEQMMLARHLNIRSKEHLTVSRLRMLRETAERAGTRVGALGRGLISDGDLALIERLIESDQISTEMYQERLDSILQIGHEADREAAGLSPAGQELLKIWSDMDAGLIKDTGAAFDEAERRVRERQKASEA
jgi:septum formation topological specificity factor MinE